VALHPPLAGSAPDGAAQRIGVPGTVRLVLGGRMSAVRHADHVPPRADRPAEGGSGNQPLDAAATPVRRRLRPALDLVREVHAGVISAYACEPGARCFHW
jgi:hypothetical protein